MSVILENVKAPTDELRVLLEELDRTLSAEYLPEQRHGLTLEAIFQRHVRFFLARVNGDALGCGGVALFSNFAEVKRMYVRENARGRGIAGALLSRIESEAKENGRDVLRLETGDRQFAAMRFYERSGFRRCEAFGEYAAMPHAAIATSLFYEKRLP